MTTQPIGYSWEGHPTYCHHCTVLELRENEHFLDGATPVEQESEHAEELCERCLERLDRKCMKCNGQGDFQVRDHNRIAEFDCVECNGTGKSQMPNAPFS